jgi:hypothetical protein
VAELAGIHVFESDGVVRRILTSTGKWVHQMEDGRTFTLPGDGGYQPGSRVYAGEIAGAMVAARHRSLQGENWWYNRPWGAAGIAIEKLRPGFSGFSIRDEPRNADCGLVAGALRARIFFGQDAYLENIYWTWQAACETRTGVETFARDVLGFTAAGSKSVNPLGVWAGMLGPWLTVLESPLHRYDPGLWQEMLDFIEREKPAGSLVLLLPV